MNPNPFDQDGVIRIFLKEADIPTLKTLRELNSNWNSLDLKELENRAKEGEFRDYNFSWGHRGNQKTLEDAKEELGQFLEATKAIPKLFRDFRFHFPQSLKLLNSSFFSKYPPMFIYLDIHSFIPFNEDTTKLLLNFLSWVAPTLKELYIGDIYCLTGDVYHTNWLMPEDFSEISEIPQDQLKFPKLNKFSMNRYTKELSQFMVILDKGGEVNSAPNLKELAIGHLNTDFGDLLGLGTRSKVGYQRWSNLNRLTLYTDHYSNLGVAETFRHLCTLSQYGMTLNYLDLKLSRESIHISHFSEASVILGQFLESQSPSLEYLGILFSIKIKTSPENIPEQEFEEYQTSIRLPIFPHVLKFKIDMLSIRVNDIRQIPLEMGPFPSHFPKLRSLEIHFSDTIRDLFEKVNLEPWAVREIKLYDIPDYINGPFYSNFDWPRANFRSVISFDYIGLAFNNSELLPWTDSLEILRILSVRGLLKLADHAHLKYIEVSDCRAAISQYNNIYRKSVHSYLEHFQEILGLNLIKITFDTDEEICDEVKGHIKSYFPFEAEFVTSGPDRFF